MRGARTPREGEVCGNGAAHGTGREIRGGAVYGTWAEKCAAGPYTERDIKLKVGAGKERRRRCSAEPCTELGDKRAAGPCTVQDCLLYTSPSPRDS